MEILTIGVQHVQMCMWPKEGRYHEIPRNAKGGKRTSMASKGPLFAALGVYDSSCSDLVGSFACQEESFVQEHLSGHY